MNPDDRPARESRSLLLTYEDGAGVVTERRVSDIGWEDPVTLDAFCHLRQARRPFRLSRIRRAVDLATGEVVGDVFAWMHPEQPQRAPSPPSPPPWERPRSSVPTDEAARIRGRDRSAWAMRYRLRLIADAFRERLIAHFDGVCFRCRASGKLVIDHHVPIVLGGRLEAGNLVVLCARCNGLKADRDPTAFYSSAELEALTPQLAAEAELLAFQFDRRAWDADRKAYLLRLGVPAAAIEHVVADPDHPDHDALVRSPSDGIAASIEVDIEGLP